VDTSLGLACQPYFVMAASSGSSTSASSHDTVVIQAHMNATTALEALRRELLDAEALGLEFFPCLFPIPGHRTALGCCRSFENHRKTAG
jgi:hypothetical protein